MKGFDFDFPKVVDGALLYKAGAYACDPSAILVSAIVGVCPGPDSYNSCSLIVQLGDQTHWKPCGHMSVDVLHALYPASEPLPEPAPEAAEEVPEA